MKNMSGKCSFYHLAFGAFLLILMCSCQTVVQGEKEGSVDLFYKNEKLVKAATGYIFTEGPAVDAEGNVYFTDQPNNRILKWSTDETVETFMENAGRSNGLYFDIDGNLLACADENNQLWRISPEGSIEVLLKDFEGKKFNGPNDLWIDSTGGIYFTDPYYQRDYWTRSQKEIKEERVYYLSKEGIVTIAADGFVRPNGIVGSADGKSLYITDLGDQKTYKYAVSDNHILQDREMFVAMGSDGMTLDELGNLYITNKKGVTIINSDGEQIGNIPIEEDWISNVTFGGQNRDVLFITAMGSIYTLKMKVKGIQ